MWLFSIPDFINQNLEIFYFKKIMTSFLRFFFYFSTFFTIVQSCQGSVGEGLIHSDNPKRICRWDYTIPNGSQLYMVPKKLIMDTYCLDSIDILIRKSTGEWPRTDRAARSSLDQVVPINLESEWKKSIKMCQLTQYMLNFPKLIGDGEMQVKIIFDPSKYPQYSMFKKVPSNFEFRIEFDITNAGTREVIKLN